MKYKSSFTILIFAITAATFCFTFTSCTKEKKKAIVCLIDFSETPEWNSRMEMLKQVTINSIISKISFNTSLVILPLDKASASGSEELLSGRTLNEFDYIPDMTAPPDEDRVSQENLQKTKDSLKQEFSQLFDKALQSRVGLQKGTDIFGALEQAKRYLPEGGQNIIILLSDMMNWSNDLKMEPGNFNTASIEQALKKVPAANLSNAKILIYTGQTGYLPADHFKTVQQFWEKYFSQNNIQLVDYSSGAITKLEETVAH